MCVGVGTQRRENYRRETRKARGIALPEAQKDTWRDWS